MPFSRESTGSRGPPTPSSYLRYCGQDAPPDTVFATCRRPSGIYSFETCLALLPQLPTWLRVDLFLLPSGVPKPPRLLLLLEVKLVHTVDSKSWFKQGRKWESCSMSLGLGSEETGESSRYWLPN